MIHSWVDGFLRDCRVRELSPFTIEYYRSQLAVFEKFARAQEVTQVQDITPDLLRDYLEELKATGHNPGGRATKYRAVRAFLLWYEQEAEPEGWKSPLGKVKPPKVRQTLIEPVPITDIRAMLATCPNSFTGIRDRAMILSLLDTGARAREFLSLNLDDVDFISGAVVIRKGKNQNPRVVFIGKKARRQLRAYLRLREDESPAVWVTSKGDRLAYKSLHGMLERRGKSAGVKPPSPHDFRRAFAILMLRSGVDLITLARLMGHSTLEVLKIYLAQTTEDLQAAHSLASPVDKML